MSPTTRSTARPVRLSSSRPGSMRARTRAPRSSRARTTEEPMNPDAPVTSTGPRSVDATAMLSSHPLRRADPERNARADATAGTAWGSPTADGPIAALLHEVIGDGWVEYSVWVSFGRLGAARCDNTGPTISLVAPALRAVSRGFGSPQ